MHEQTQNPLSLSAYLIWCLMVPSLAAATEPPLVYELKPRSAHAELGEPFYVDYLVRNQSDESLVLCNCNLSGEIIFGELNESGTAPLSIDRYSTNEPPKQEDFVEVPPRSTVAFSWGGFGKEYFASPGVWVLQVRESFTSVVQQNGKRSWQGTLESPMVRVTVVVKPE